MGNQQSKYGESTDIKAARDRRSFFYCSAAVEQKAYVTLVNKKENVVMFLMMAMTMMMVMTRSCLQKGKKKKTTLLATSPATSPEPRHTYGKCNNKQCTLVDKILTKTRTDQTTKQTNNKPTTKPTNRRLFVQCERIYCFFYFSPLLATKQYLMDVFDRKENDNALIFKYEEEEAERLLQKCPLPSNDDMYEDVITSVTGGGERDHNNNNNSNKSNLKYMTY
uniref:Uncharacterized protein n=1 Tax=Glossina pallidipes TaxID=7398 RepID=A0A1A9Z8U2_GLOPL